MKKCVCVFLCAVLLSLSVCAAGEDEVSFSASSPYVIFMDMNTGRVLYEKNADEKIYPASTVKIMTAVLALENCNLEDKVTASSAALSAVPDGVTVMDIMEGEALTVRQLLYGAMLSSAADATNVLAEAVSDSVTEFIKLMNLKAAELKMTGTNFSNTHGEHDDRTYTTVRDMAALTRYAMENKDFREIVNTDQYSIRPTDKYREERKLINTNYMVCRVRRGDYYYSNAIGVKAGYTAEARSCLIEAAKKGNMELLALTFGSETVDSKAQGYLDCRRFFNTAFEHYKTRVVVSKGTLLDQLPVKHAKRANRILLETEKDLYYICPADAPDEAPTVKITVRDNISAPVSKGDVLGQCEYFYGTVSAGTVNLVADKDYSFDLIAYIGDTVLSFFTSVWFLIILVLAAAAFIFARICRVRARTLKQKRARERRRREAEKKFRKKMEELDNEE